MKLRQKIHLKTKLFFAKNSPTILTCIGAAGMISTVIFAVKATPKAIELLEEEKKAQGEELTKVDIVLTAGPAYIPTIALGTATLACFFGANVLSQKQTRSLTAAYALLERTYNDYRNKLIELHGEEMDKEIRDAIVRDHANYHVIDCDIPENKLIWYDDISGNSVSRYEREIIDAEYHLNRNFTMRGYATLNEFYEFLGMPLTEYGERMVWSMEEGYSWIDFEHRLINRDDGGTPIYSIDSAFGLIPIEECCYV